MKTEMMLSVLAALAGIIWAISFIDQGDAQFIVNSSLYFLIAGLYAKIYIRG